MCPDDLDSVSEECEEPPPAVKKLEVSLETVLDSPKPHGRRESGLFHVQTASSRRATLQDAGLASVPETLSPNRQEVLGLILFQTQEMRAFLSGDDRQWKEGEQGELMNSEVEVSDNAVVAHEGHWNPKSRALREFQFYDSRWTSSSAGELMVLSHHWNGGSEEEKLIDIDDEEEKLIEIENGNNWSVHMLSANPQVCHRDLIDHDSEPRQRDLFRENVGGFVGMIKTNTGFEQFSGFGDTSWNIWKDRFCDVIDASPQPIPDERKAKILKCYLSGPARAFVENLPATASFKDMLDHLEGKFSTDSSRTSARMRLQNCKQVPGEKVLAFANRLANLVRDVVKPGNKQAYEERLMQEFLDKLRPDISFYLQVHGVTDFDSALAKAETIESYRVAQREQKGVSFTFENSNVAALRNQQFVEAADWSQGDNDAFEDEYDDQGNFANGDGYRDDPIQCFRCGQYGHIARICREYIPPEEFPYPNDDAHEQCDLPEHNQDTFARLEHAIDRLSSQVEQLQVEYRRLASMWFGKPNSQQ